LTAVKFEFVVFGILTSCNGVVGYKRFGASCSSGWNTLVSYYITTRRSNPGDHDLKVEDHFLYGIPT